MIPAMAANKGVHMDRLPENKPLYKDSGLWQMRSDDMNEVLVQQKHNESINDFIVRCEQFDKTATTSPNSQRTPCEWISVKDRLPKEGENVLATDGSSVFVAAYKAGDIFPDWWDTAGNDHGDVTHWMPLPSIEGLK